MKTVDAVGKEEASPSELNKEKSSACQFVMTDGEQWQQSGSKKVKVKIALI